MQPTMHACMRAEAGTLQHQWLGGFKEQALTKAARVQSLAHAQLPHDDRAVQRAAHQHVAVPWAESHLQQV